MSRQSAYIYIEYGKPYPQYCVLAVRCPIGEGPFAFLRSTVCFLFFYSCRLMRTNAAKEDKFARVKSYFNIGLNRFFVVVARTMVTAKSTMSIEFRFQNNSWIWNELETDKINFVWEFRLFCCCWRQSIENDNTNDNTKRNTIQSPLKKRRTIFFLLTFILLIFQKKTKKQNNENCY